VEFKEAVLGMEVTPTVLPDSRVRLKLRITQNMPGQVLQQADGEVLAIDKQEIETQVEIKSGDTLALGGIFSQKNKLGSDSVPILGGYPGLADCFVMMVKIMSAVNWWSLLHQGSCQFVDRYIFCIAFSA
jgi:protein transport protein HofQ